MADTVTMPPHGSWGIAGHYVTLAIVGSAIVLIPGWIFDRVAWELSYDLVLPVHEGHYRVRWMWPFLPALLASAGTLGAMPRLPLTRSVLIALAAWISMMIAWCLWGAIAVWKPHWIETLPLDTLGSPRRYVVLMALLRGLVTLVVSSIGVASLLIWRGRRRESLKRLRDQA